MLIKLLDRQHEKNLSQIQVPNVINLDAEEAKRHLEEIGFRVTLTRKPNKKIPPRELLETIEVVAADSKSRKIR